MGKIKVYTGVLAFLAIFLMGAGTSDDKFNIGTGSTTTNKELRLGTNHVLRSDITGGNKIQFSNNGGTDWKDVGSGGGGGSGIDTLSELNGDCETGNPTPADWTMTGSGTFTAETGSPGNGDQSCSWTPSTTGEYLRSTLVEHPAIIEGNVCTSRIYTKWPLGVSGTLKWYVENSALDKVTTTKNVIVSAGWVPDMLAYTCPAPGTTVRVVFESFAATSVFLYDDAELGTTGVFTGVEDTLPVCSIISSSKTADFGDYKLADGRTIGRTDFPSYFSDCGVVFGNGDGSTTVHLPDFRGRFLRGVNTTGNGVSGNDPDAAARTVMNTGGNPGDLVGSIQGDLFDSHNHGGGIHGHNLTREIVGRANADAQVDYGSASAHAWDLDYFGNLIANSGTIIVTQGGSENRPKNAGINFFIKVKGSGTGSSEAITLETTGAYWNVNVGGGQVSLGTSSIATYTELIDANLDLVVNPGSQPAEIPCSGVNPSTGLTCSVGSEGVGFVPEIKQSGEYYTCVTFSHKTEADASGFVNATFQLVETSNTSQVIIQEGNTRLQSSPDDSGTSANASSQPISICSVFTFSSVGEKTIRLMYEQTTATTITTNVIHADRSVSLGQRDINFTMFPITQQFPTPVFTDLQESLSQKPEYGTDRKMCSFRLDMAATTVGLDSGCVQSASNNAVGDDSITFVPGFWTSIDLCICNGQLGSADTSGYTCHQELTITTTTARFIGKQHQAAGPTIAFDVLSNIICYGQ